VLRNAGVAVDRAFDNRSMKSQLRAADRSGATIALIIGAEEEKNSTVMLKVLRGEPAHLQEQVARNALVDRVKEILS
jgi:histidyl-tRNA synthetase